MRGIRGTTTERWFEPNLATSILPVSLSAITPTSHFLLLFFTFSEATEEAWKAFSLPLYNRTHAVKPTCK